MQAKALPTGSPLATSRLMTGTTVHSQTGMINPKNPQTRIESHFFFGKNRGVEFDLSQKSRLSYRESGQDKLGISLGQNGVPAFGGSQTSDQKFFDGMA